MTGCRKCEILALTWSDYDGGGITINKTCSHVNNAITPPKTKNSYRKIYLDTLTIQLLNNLKKQATLIDDYDDNKYIFGFYTPISTSALERKYKKYQKIANVKIIRFHDLRHSHASLLIDNKMPLPVVASRLGDNIETILKTYTHLFNDSHTEVLNLLNKL